MKTIIENLDIITFTVSLLTGATYVVNTIEPGTTWIFKFIGA